MSDSGHFPNRTLDDAPSRKDPQQNLYEKKVLGQQAAQLKQDELTRFCNTRRFPALRHKIQMQGVTVVPKPKSKKNNGRNKKTANPFLDKRLFEDVTFQSPLATFRAKAFNQRRNRATMENARWGPKSGTSGDSGGGGRGAGGRGGGSSYTMKQHLRARERLAKRPPFRPCNPHEARRMRAQNPVIDSEPLFFGCPYDAEHQQNRKWRAKKRDIMTDKRPFYTTSNPSEAKTRIEVDYFLNSADHGIKQAEKQIIKEKAKRNIQAFKERLKETEMTRRVRMNRRHQPMEMDL